MSRDVKYIGIDVHKEAIVIAVLNEDGKLAMESIVETKASRIQFRLVRSVGECNRDVTPIIGTDGYNLTP